MRIRFPGNITPQDAITLQQRLAPLVRTDSKLPNHISTLVGCDATYVSGTTIAAAVSLDYSTLRRAHVRLLEEPTTFPYIPGLLAFREGGPVVRAVRALRESSYVCMVDGHGVAHPRKFGLACFVGLILDRPTIGVAKSLLYGSVDSNRVLDGQGCVVAELMTLPETKKTIYVSVGHKISLRDAIQVVKTCLTPKGPLPIRLAHEEVTNRKCLNKKSSPAFS
jgi:deoxyribonuclease V